VTKVLQPKTGYTGTAYIGVVGSDTEYGECRDSIDLIGRRNGDSQPVYARATKGYEARQKHITRFIDDTRHDFCLLLDADMIFHRDTLEKLRVYGLPYITGYYMRRSLNPIAPVWFRPYNGQLPLEPWIGEPERGVLHTLGASGWGCMLIHREVILKTRKILKGEWDILEDDMDLWPYDLVRIMQAIKGLRMLLKEKPDDITLFPALEAHVKALETEIKPLRADKESIGSDIRYPFYALAAGYQLLGDPDVRPGHCINYPLSANDYENIPQEVKDKVKTHTLEKVIEERKHIQNLKRLLR
jgi:hypothetical protein